MRGNWGAVVAVITLVLSCACGAGQDPPPVFPWNLSVLGLPSAWGVSRGDGQVIAILDSGLADHGLPSLHGRVVWAHSVIEDTAADRFGHGTAVASLAAGSGDASVWGVAPHAKVMPVRVVGLNGLASPGAVASGIRWATSHGATVVNLSLGMAAEDPDIAGSVSDALDAGVIVVAAAGDSAGAGPLFPASQKGVLAVRGIGQDGTPGPRANPAGPGGIDAPGRRLVAVLSSSGAPRPIAGSVSGSSYAAAEISGVVALLQSCAANHGHKLTSVDILHALRAGSADAFPSTLSTALGVVGCN